MSDPGVAMAAGGSAAQHAQLQRERALVLQRQADAAREAAGRYEVAASIEHRIVGQLGRLSAQGYHVLADRAWPGSRRANVDCVVVGPSGVFIVDPKCWADVSLHQGRIYRGQEDVTADLEPLANLAETTRTALAEVGLPPRQVHVIAVLAGWADLSTIINGVEVLGERRLLSRIVAGGHRLSAENVDAMLQACLTLFPVHAGTAAGAPTEKASPKPRPDAERRALPPAQRTPGSSTAQPEQEPQLQLLSDTELQDAILDGIQGRPIEDWMSFLHPEQARLVRRDMTGPARVRGAAGTGKTVVGLHRAAWLAQTRPGRILVTSYVRTVPQVLKSLYLRLAPESADRLDFMGVHALALDVLRRRGLKPQVDADGARLEFDRAWSQVGVRGALNRSMQNRDYWREEVGAVIKGRGLTDFEQYEKLQRVGRRYRLSTEQRQAVWDLYQQYQVNLAARGLVDFEDVLIKAESLLREHGPDREYASIVVDEVQDLSCVGIRLLHTLVGDRPDGLLLIGDGQQAIYPGGFTLSEVGIDVRGRATVLKRNYRNTKEILDTAQQIVSGDTFGDLDDLDELGDRDVEVTRRGPAPTRVVVGGQRDLEHALLRTVVTATQRPGVQFGDIAVLVPSTGHAGRYLRVLERERIPAMNLADYTGAALNRVKVGTYHRAKGLDFKHVLLPQWDATPVARDDDETDAAHRERVERERRTLFVAMTRARDELWLGSIRPT